MKYRPIVRVAWEAARARGASSEKANLHLSISRRCFRRSKNLRPNNLSLNRRIKSYKRQKNQIREAKAEMMDPKPRPRKCQRKCPGSLKIRIPRSSLKFHC